MWNQHIGIVDVSVGLRWASLVLVLAVLSVVGLRAQTAPGAPTIGTASAISRAVVAFTAPASDGGSPITVYTATSSPGGITGTGTRSPIYVTGLTGGTAYTFTVTATNAVGTSSASAASNSVTPSSTLIPADSSTDWSVAGAGAIPARATQCGTTILASAYGNGTVDASTAITDAVAACPDGQHVLLGPGNFLINTAAVNIRKAVTLRGSGVGVTLLKRTLTTGQEPLVILGPRSTSPDETTAVNLTADGVKGTTAVTVTNATGFAAGQYVLIDEDDWYTATYVPMPPLVNGNPNPLTLYRTDRLVWALKNPPQSGDCPPETCPGVFGRFGRPLAEIKEVASVSGNTITFTSPIHITYQTAKQAQLVRFTSNIHIAGMGVEDLSTIGGNNGNIKFSSAAKSWMKNVEVTSFLSPGINVTDSFRVTIRDSYIHDAISRAPGSGGYLMTLMNASSEVLIENNIFISGNKVMTAQSAGAGSVIAYNYLDNSQISYDTTWQEVGLNGSHWIGPHLMLFEGNLSVNYDSDDTHGNSIYQTVFRNHFTGLRRDHIDAKNVRTVGLESGSFWQTFVGNVLGTPAMPPAGGGGTGSSPMAWVYEDPGDGTYGTGASQPWGMSANPSIWRLGYWTGMYTTQADPQVLSTVVRDRNWDYVTDSVRSDRATPTFLPNSLYLSAKPSFFETADTWPWVDPVGATKTFTLPAKRRYEAIVALPGGAGYSYTQGQYAHLTPGAPTHTFTSANTAGRSIIVGAGWVGTTAPTISDTRKNTYTLVQLTTNGVFSAAIWAAHGITAGANTVTLTHASDIDAVFTEYAGLTATDKATGRPGMTRILTSGGTDVTTTANQMVFGFGMAQVNATYTPAASSTMNARAFGGGAAYTVASEDKRTNLAGTYEADFTHTGNGQQWIALVATFKEAAGSPVVPSAPSIGTATAGVQQATVSFIGSASDGGSAITSYTVTSSPPGGTASGAGSPITVTGLTAGTAYTFTVRATNAIGQGPASSASNSVTPTGATGYAHVQSLYGHAVSGATAVTINVTAGTMLTIAATWDSATVATIALSQGSAPGLRRHQVSGSTSTAIWSAFARPAGSTTVTLTLAGATFDVIVAEYSGLQSAAQRSIGASGTGGTPSSGAAAVTTTANAMVFGVARHDGGAMPTPGAGFTLRGTGNTGTIYLATEDRRVTATGTYAADFGATSSAWTAVVNVIGEATQTDTTNPVVTITTPATASVNVTATPYPTISGTASDAVGVVSCAWTNAAGGSGIPTGTTTWSFTDVGLSLGANLITVVCLDGAGNAGTDTVTINYTTVAGPPTIGTATAGNAQATVTFTPPGADGGSAITGYTVTSAPPGGTGTGAASPITVTGLTNGTPYSFTVTATNAVGVSLPSASSNQVTPVTVPGPPTIGTATAGTSTVSVAFTPNASNGGSPVTVYTATSAPGGFQGTAGASPIAVEGLAPATAYTFTVIATNAIGNSTASAASNSVTLAAPTEQRTLTADIYHLAPGPCFIRSGDGAPSGSLGGICDVYYRTDTPYTSYRKTASGTWAALTAHASGTAPYTQGDLIVANSASGLGRVAAPAVGQVLSSTGAGVVPQWTANPSLTSIGGAANLTLSPAGDVILGPAGNDILPSVGYTKNLGSLTNKFLTLHAAELWVETLVAQETIATIGGRVLVGPTTVLTSDLVAAANTITVKHNNLDISDIVHLEAQGKFERMRITGGPSGVAGSFIYNVTRTLDTVGGANDWIAGDAVFNTGIVGDGFIDLYSLSSVIGSSVIGPTVAGIVRTGINHNDLEPRWAIGNMNGLFQYGHNIYGAGFGDGKQTPTGPWLKIDSNAADPCTPANQSNCGGGGIRAGAGPTTYFNITPTGDAWFSGDLTVGTGGRNMLANSEFLRGRGTGDKDGSYWGGTASFFNPGAPPGGAFTCAAPCTQNQNPPLLGEEDGTTGFDNSTGLSMTMNVNLPDQFPINGGALFWTMNGTPPVGTYSRAWGPKIPVTPGRRVEYSFYSGVHRGGQLSARLVWINADGAIISETDGSVTNATCNGLTGLGGSSLSNYCRAWNISDAPATASYVIPTIFQLYDTTSAPLGPQPYTFVTRMYFGVAQEGQIAPSPWGPAGTSLITGEMMSTDLVLANTLRSPGVLAFDIGTGYWLDAANTPPTFRVGNPLGNRFSWDGTNLTLGQGNVSIDANGITVASNTGSTTWAAANAYRFGMNNMAAAGIAGVDLSTTNRSMLYTLQYTGGQTTMLTQHIMRSSHTGTGTNAATEIIVTASSGVSSINLSTGIGATLNTGTIVVGGLLNFGGATSPTAGSIAGYVNVLVGGNAYRIPIYNP